MRSRRAAVIAVALACIAADTPEPPSDQTVVFYNARIAMREARHGDVLKLWLLRNGLVDQGKKPSPEDGELRSVVWAAMGAMGTCPDGYDRDESGGAGLWPIAMHNWLLDASKRGPAPPQPPPFGAFEVTRQQRRVSLDDVLQSSEMRSLAFMRTGCFAAVPWLIQSAENPLGPLRDRRVAAPLLRRMLATGLGTLDRSKVESVAAIEARLFDLDLAIVQLETRAAMQRGLERQRRARILGVSEAGAAEARAAIPERPAATSAQAALLKASLRWSVEDWMSLSRTRRLYLFDRATAFSTSPEALDRLVLGLVDDRIGAASRRRAPSGSEEGGTPTERIENGAGAELELWIGMYGAEEPARRNALFEGARGASLLELDAESGFKERSVIALHRGVAFLEAGELEDALRSFAFAMKHAEDSRESAAVIGLSRRWLSYTLSRYETTEDVIAILEALVPRQEFNAVIEDLVWRAALRADAKSFDRAIQNTRRGGAFDLMVSRLKPLSRGKAGEMVTELRKQADTEPSLTLRFVGKLVEKIEAEEASVRAASVPMLELLRKMLEPLAEGEPGKPKKSSARAAELHLGRIRAILDGLERLDAVTARDKARTQAPGRDTFAGAIRLAPADDLPWPFARPETDAPSPFTPLKLTPVEWKDAKGTLVFGWRITDEGE